MNKILRRLLVAALALSASHVSASSNKTFLMPRSDGYNMPLRRVTFTEACEHNAEERFGGNFQIGFFYSDSTNRNGMGEYFGPGGGKRSFTFGTAGAQGDLWSRWFALADTAATVNLNPRHESYGVNFNYHQDLDKILNGLYFRVNLPVAHVENNVEMTVSGAGADGVRNYLKGQALRAEQAALTSALINGAHSETGVADIDLQLGYAFLRKEAYKASINLGLTCPTGNKADGKYLFEPIYGQGKHWGFGAGADFTARIWGDDHQNFKLNIALDYRYLFEATEKRTLGVIDDGAMTNSASNLRNNAWGQYQLAGIVGQNMNVAGTFVPLANILTQNVGVTPGSLVDGIVGLAYNNGGWTLDLGYNLYFREGESVKRKDAWDDTKYAYVSGTEVVGAAPFDARGGGVTATQLDVNAAANPSQFTNKIYGQVGYIFRNWEYPVLVSGGAHYEFRSNNASIENWGFNVKAGISF